MLVEKLFDTGEVNLNYAEGPNNGPPLTLIHGATDRWQSFNHIIPALSENWHIYAIDLRGRGKSSRKSPHYRLQDLVTDTVEFIKKQVKEPGVIFGHSLGGLVAIWSTVLLPKQVNSLILGDTPLNIKRLIEEKNDENAIERYRGFQVLCGRSVEELVEVLGEKYPSYSKESVKYMAEAFSRCDPDIGMYHAEGRQDEFYREFRIEKFLPRISCPILWILVKPELGMNSNLEVEYALELNSGIQTVLIEGVDHELGLDTGNISSLLSAIESFLSSL
jgi:pimeloyl-ACP methyl ester carboxylesterase